MGRVGTQNDNFPCQKVQVPSTRLLSNVSHPTTPIYGPRLTAYYSRNTVARMQNHMVSPQCPDQETHAELKAAHQDNSYKDKPSNTESPIKRRHQRAKDMKLQLKETNKAQTFCNNSDSTQTQEIQSTPAVTTVAGPMHTEPQIAQDVDHGTIEDPTILLSPLSSVSPIAPQAADSFNSAHRDVSSVHLYNFGLVFD